jgi:hypothetical protein
MKLSAFQGFTDNRERQRTFVGLAGSRFVLSSAGEDSAAPPSVRLLARARTKNCKEIWVYTDAEDHIARDFYLRLDFEVIGPAHEWAYGKTADSSDVVFRRKLVANV